MFREIREEDRALYYDFVDKFYHTDAVNAPVPTENYEITFNEMLRSDAYLKGYIFEYEGTPCGFGYIAICKDPQLYIDKLSGNILETSMMNTKKRWLYEPVATNLESGEQETSNLSMGV